MELLKILHFLALAVGLGGGIANGIVGAKAGPKDPVLAGQIQGLLGRLSGVALIVLWVTGLWMALAGGVVPDLWFWLKMLAVVVLTLGSARMMLAMRTPGPHLAAFGKKMGPVMVASSTLAVIFAVLAFG